MKESLLKYIKCPKCQGSLEVSQRNSMESGEIIEGLLSCSACKETFPIKNSFPHLLDSQFLGMLKNELTKVKSRYEYEWKQFPGLFDLEEGSEEEFFSLTSLSPEDLTGKVVSDIGCGAGRHTQIAAKYAKEVIALELSESGLMKTKELCRNFDNVHYVLGNVCQTPFADQTFDLSYCLGVLTFLPDPLQGFRDVARITKKDGVISVYVLNRKSSWYEFLDRNVRKITSRLPNSLLHFFSLCLVPFIPLMKSVKGTQKRRESEGVGHVFDWLSSATHHSHTREEVNGWFLAEGIKEIIFSNELLGVTGWKKTTHEQVKTAPRP